MTARPPEDALLDLVVVGGLTIDRFEDDLAPGGSVLHATRAAADAGLRAAVITVAGDEPTARSGSDELRARAASVDVQAAGETIRFRHREGASGRRLWLEAAGGPIRLTAEVGHRLRTQALLFAPVASELGAPVLELAQDRWSPDTWTHAAILQGWLRRPDAGREVVPIAPTELDDRLVAVLARCGVLVASREDLLAADPRPVRQLAALRARVGPGPILVVTDGPEGLWLDDGPSAPRHLPAPWRVDGVPMVGAGDAFAALFVAGLARRPVPSDAELDALALTAMRGVADMLEARRPG